MKLERTGCYLCDHSKSQPWGGENGFLAVRCQECGLVYLARRPGDDQIDQASRIGYHDTRNGTLNTVGRYSVKKERDYRQKISRMADTIGINSKECCWLDVGAGHGEFVSALAKTCAPGSAILGIEPSGPKVKQARKKGLPVESTSLSEVKGKFTHVSLINVFSHLPNPIEFLADLKRVMEPGAMLVLVTGNAGDLERAEVPGSLYLPDHLSFAGEKHVKSILDRAGLNLIDISRYAFRTDNLLLGIVKNGIRKALGRVPVPLRVSRDSKFRSMWYIAELRD